MKYILKVLFLFALLAILHHDEAMAQRRGGGGRGGGGRGGAMRGGGGGMRGGGMKARGGARTSVSSRPRPASRPAARPSRSAATRPAAARPATRPAAAARQPARAATRPGTDIGRPGTPATRPGTRPGAGAGGIRDTNIGSRTNIDNNHINIDNEVDIDGDWGDWGDGCCFVDHPIAAGVVAGTTAAIVADAYDDDDYYPYPYYDVGTTVYTIPSDCTTVVTDGVTYKQCGDQYYEPSFYGTDVTYTVVSP